MSVVIGLKNKGRVILAADKQASKGGSKDHSAIKVFEIKGCPGLIVGSVGRLKMLQILRFASNIVNLNSFNSLYGLVSVKSAVIPFISRYKYPAFLYSSIIL